MTVSDARTGAQLVTRLVSRSQTSLHAGHPPPVQTTPAPIVRDVSIGGQSPPCGLLGSSGSGYKV